MAVLGLIGGPVLVGAAVAILFGVIEAGSVWQIIATLPELVWELSLGIYLMVKGFKPTAPILSEPDTAGQIKEVQSAWQEHEITKFGAAPRTLRGCARTRPGGSA